LQGRRLCSVEETEQSAEQPLLLLTAATGARITAAGSTALGSTALRGAALGSTAPRGTALGSTAPRGTAFGSAAFGSAALRGTAFGSTALRSAALGSAALRGTALGTAAVVFLEPVEPERVGVGGAGTTERQCHGKRANPLHSWLLLEFVWKTFVSDGCHIRIIVTGGLRCRSTEADIQTPPL